MNYEFHPAAEAEYLESIAFYESRGSGLGASFMQEFEAAMDVICTSPCLYAIAREPDIRRAQMRRFPYSVLYREREESIQVLAVAHSSRRPDYWLNRAR